MTFFRCGSLRNAFNPLFRGPFGRFGKPQPTAVVAEVTPEPTPPVPPPVSCTTPNLFSDCFTGLAGSIPPGTVGGWSATAFGLGGTVTFNGDRMVFAINGGGNSVLAQKALLAAPPTSNFTLHYRLILPTTIETSQCYDVFFRDAGGNETGRVSLCVGSTALVRRFQAPGMIQNFSSVVVPPMAAGQVMTVHLTVDAAGVPSLFIDGVPIALVVGIVDVTAVSTANTMFVTTTSNTMTYTDAAFDWIMLASGVLVPSTVFCCPDGQPAQ